MAEQPLYASARVGLLVAVVLVTLTGCTAAPATVATITDSPTAEPSATPTPEPTEPPLGSRQNPFPYGSATVIEEGDAAGADGWKITINEPADITALIVAEAMDAYGGNEDYVYASRPPEGQIHLGVSGTVERLLDDPMDPFYSLDIQFITSDGRTLETAPYSTDTSPWLMDIGEMYAPATSGFTEVFSVDPGTTGQVLITSDDTGERFYFGPPSP